MAITAVWKGLIRFGLISIAVKLYKAAQAEKVSFRQVHKETGARVRHTLRTEDAGDAAAAAQDEPVKPAAVKRKPTGSREPLAVHAAAALQTAGLSRADVGKGYEYQKGRYVCISRDELTGLVPPTARETEIRQFVQPVEMDPVSIDSTFFVVPDRGAERAYALLYEALCRSGSFGVTQITMNSRESVVVLRPSGNGIVAQTLFYEPEIRRERQYRAAASMVSPKELNLALRLIEQRSAPFEPMSYFDTYREAVQRLVRTRTAGDKATRVRSFEAGDANNLLQTLEQSLSAAAPKQTAAENVVAMSACDRKAKKRIAS